MKKYRSGFWFAVILVVFMLFSAENGFLLCVSAADFTENLSGATGWGTTTLYMYGSGSDSSGAGQVGAREPFRILGSTADGLLQIEYNGTVGYVDSTNVLINLPDVQPDIIYNLTNATGSIFTSTTENGTANLKLSIFGSQLYYNGDVHDFYSRGTGDGTSGLRTGKVWNAKLGKYEFIVPVLYSAAEKISAARELAVADGYELKIYDAYRTNVATQLMNSSMNSLYDQYGNALRLGGYDTSFYVASSLSSHNVGCAIDVTMVYGAEEADMPTKMHVLSSDAVLLPYGTSAITSSQLAGRPYSYYEQNFASTMTEDARRLCWYMITAGLTGLGSEWWHYQDQAAYNANSGYYSNLATWYPCEICAARTSDGQVPQVVTRRGEAAYQLWAAAGFPSASGDISFTDVTEYDYYYNAVRWAVSAGVMSGSSQTTFSPDDAITRAGFLNCLYRYCGSPAGEGSGTGVFEDVSPNAWYYAAVQWAAKAGITEETAGVFGPSSVLTQEQMHVFLTRAGAAGIPLVEYYI